VDWQAERAAEVAATTRPPFPPLRVVRGLFRVRVVVALALGTWFGNAQWRFIERNCRTLQRDWLGDVLCPGEGLIGAAVFGLFVSAACALALWMAQHLVMWVWRGFRET